MYEVPVKFEALGTGDNREGNKDPALLKLVMSWLRHVKCHIHCFPFTLFFPLQNATNALKEKNKRL